MLTKIEEIRASAAQTVGTETGSAIKFQKNWHQVTFILDITALATEVDDTLDIYIDTSYDGGVSWVNVGHFSQALGNGSAAKHVMLVHEAVNSEIDVTSDVAAGSVRNLALGDRIRYRGVVVDPTGSNGSFTYSIKAFYGNGKH